MKKTFLACLTALSLTGISFAQDDEYEEVVYEEVEEAPAKAPKKQTVVYEEVEEDEDAAPAPKKKKAKSAPSKPAEHFFGVGIDVLGLLKDDYRLNLVFNLNENMTLTGILGFYHGGETTIEVNSQDVKQGDDYTYISLGAGFDYVIPSAAILPVSVGGEIIYTHNREDDSELDFNILGGVYAKLSDHLTLNAKAGLNINYHFWTGTGNYQGTPIAGDCDRLSFGIASKVYLTWFLF